MKDSTKKELVDLLKGIPSVKRRLNPYFDQPMDFKRMIKVSIASLDNDDTLNEDDIRSICEEFEGDGYSHLLSNPKFTTDFAGKIISEISSAKHFISIYREISTSE